MGCSVSPSSIALSSQVENGLSNGKSRARWLVTDGPSLALQLLTSIHCPCGHQLRGEQASNIPLLSPSAGRTCKITFGWRVVPKLCFMSYTLAWVIVSIRWIRWEENWNRIPGRGTSKGLLLMPRPPRPGCRESNSGLMSLPPCAQDHQPWSCL